MRLILIYLQRFLQIQHILGSSFSHSDDQLKNQSLMLEITPFFCKPGTDQGGLTARAIASVPVRESRYRPTWRSRSVPLPSPTRHAGYA